MANPRTKARIEARIRERVAYCIEFELNDPRTGFITVTKVEISDDLSVAKVFYTVLGSEGVRSRTAHMLEDASGFVRRQVARVLKMRRVPRLVWLYDDSIEYAERMEQAIADALEHDRKINPSAHRDSASAAAEPPAPVDELEQEYLEFLDAQEDEEA
jgi:ribosome-binding factor A